VDDLGPFGGVAGREEGLCRAKCRRGDSEAKGFEAREENVWLWGCPVGVYWFWPCDRKHPRGHGYTRDKGLGFFHRS
jgi:hypothetical protein